MVRSAGVPVALLVLVGAPVLIGQQPSKDEQRPAPSEASLTVQLQGDEGHDKPKLVRVKAAGTPAGDPVTLASDDGLATARVTKVPEERCEKENARRIPFTGSGAKDWCLLVDRTREHAEMSGTVTGKDATPLALTVKHREEFWSLPAIVLAAALILSVLATLLAPAWESAIGGGRLAALVARNGRAGRNRISGLRQWVTKRKKEEAKASDLLHKLAPIVNQGPAKASEARRVLADAAGKTKVPAGHPYLEGAAAIANPDRPHAITDFLDEEGNGVDHPADRWNEGLAKLETRREELASAQVDAERLNEQCREAVEPRLNEATYAFGRIATPEAVPELEQPFTRLRSRLDEKLGDVTCLEPGEALGAAGGLADEAREFAARVTDLSAGSLTGSLFRLVAATALLIGIALVVAFYTVKFATFDSNETFGNAEDWFGFVTAGFASGVAATVAGLLSPWGVSTGEE